MSFDFDDAGTFESNVVAFAKKVEQMDASLGTLLAQAMPKISNTALKKADFFDNLLHTFEQPAPDGNKDGAGSVVSLPAQPTGLPSPQSHWFLEKIEIEGFRGINNEGSPLVLKFDVDAVNSISAPNGVGKSSIYEALSFALTGGIPKLDKLLASERPQDYYLNKFHPGTSGTVALTVRPETGGSSVTITVTRTASGTRTVSGPTNFDAKALLKELNREFVLLDAHTFQSFIDLKALERGRAFSGLLGLAQYSLVRQELQALSNTKSFNSHFDTTGHSATKVAADRRVTAAKKAIGTDYELLVKEPIDPVAKPEQSQARCHAALSAIQILQNCVKGSFLEIGIDECIEAVKAAEGGEKRQRYGDVIRDQETWSKANHSEPSTDDLARLLDLADARDKKLAATAGSALNELYKLSERVMLTEGWPSPNLCPTCERDDGSSVLQFVQEKLAEFEAVETATNALAEEWKTKGWGDLVELEFLAANSGEPLQLKDINATAEKGQLTEAQAAAIRTWIVTLRERAASHLGALAAERAMLEKELPPSHVAVTTAIEAARRLQTSWRELAAAKAIAVPEALRVQRLEQIKTFLDEACELFANAESKMAAERLKKVQPVCQDLFGKIMFSPVVPALLKKTGGEELTIRLADFWGLHDVSAQALLSESYRNAFSVSVYLAAASLYGGAPRFMVLDDVTSSFDAGHQHHLVEVIRTGFARPLTTGGPQLILLSHDTLLEKLFNKLSNAAGWRHQRLEGTAHTAVLPQSGAVNKVRDATKDLLNAGRVDEAAPRLRQYLEYTLQEVIDRCRIPVPMDLAFNDEKRTAGEYLSAIQAAVDLHSLAKTLALDASQVTNLGMYSATIVGNFLSHWSTGQTQAFSAPALLGVMQAIDNFRECFRFEPTPGAGRRFYKSLSQR